MTTARMAGCREARVAVGLWGQEGRWATVKSHRPRPGGLAAARLRAQARLSTALRLSAARLIGCDEAVGCRLPTPVRLASLGHERV
jgi:hypothetical protein